MVLATVCFVLGCQPRAALEPMSAIDGVSGVAFLEDSSQVTAGLGAYTQLFDVASGRSVASRDVLPDEIETLRDGFGGTFVELANSGVYTVAAEGMFDSQDPAARLGTLTGAEVSAVRLTTQGDAVVLTTACAVIWFHDGSETARVEVP